MTVAYFGNAHGNDHFLIDFYFLESWIWTLSEPYGASHWRPCKDMNCDKADSVDIHITVPENHIATSIRTLVEETILGPGLKTFHWEKRYPISTYLVAVTSDPFLELNYS